MVYAACARALDYERQYPVVTALSTMNSASDGSPKLHMQMVAKRRKSCKPWRFASTPQVYGHRRQHSSGRLGFDQGPIRKQLTARARPAQRFAIHIKHVNRFRPG